MRRFAGAALLLALWMAVCLALGEDTVFATCELPNGAVSLALVEAGGWDAPAGLEGMYDLMFSANLMSDVYLVRMKNGRALLSISSCPGVTPLMPEAFLSRWPRIAAAIGQEARYVDDSPSCASVTTAFGQDVFAVHTSIAVGTDELVLLDAQGYAFTIGTDMIEVWAVAPADPVYLYDEAAAAELMSDRADLSACLESLAFPGAQTY